jgi:uncharacterized protein (TIGR03435 family)
MSGARKIVSWFHIDPVGVAMPGSRLPQRIRAIVNAAPAVRLSRLRAAAIIAACAITCATFFAATFTRAQSAVGPVPKWDDVSIKPCDAASDNVSPSGGRARGATPPASFSPVRMTLNCQSLLQYVEDAYLLFPNGQNPVSRLFALSTPIEGAPEWMKKERYKIEAIADANTRPPMMEGPMLQAMLEDRFKLKLHHETREVPVYDLVVAKGGPKLTPFVEGSCVPFSMDNAGSTVSPEADGTTKSCRRGMGGSGGNRTIMDDATTLDLFCRDFLNSVGDDHRRVINKTGLTGTYSIYLQYSASQADRDEMIARGITPPDPTGPEIFTAIREQLGLKLVPDKGPGDFLVIDRIEEPTPN